MYCTSCHRTRGVDPIEMKCGSCLLMEKLNPPTPSADDLAKARAVLETGTLTIEQASKMSDGSGLVDEQDVAIINSTIGSEVAERLFGNFNTKKSRSTEKKSGKERIVKKTMFIKI